MKLIAGIVLIVIIAGGGWLYMQKDTVANTTQDTPATGETGGITSTMPAMIAEVVYSDAGFSPAEVTLPVGGTVTWKNESTVNMWVASAMHPTHTTYNGTNLSEHCADEVPASTEVFDQCRGMKPGESWSFTFTKEGDWKYHDHITSRHFGSIKVEKIEEMVVSPDQSAE